MKKEEIIQRLLSGTADEEQQREAAEMIEGKVPKPKLTHEMTFTKDGKIREIKAGKDSYKKIAAELKKEGWIEADERKYE